MVHPLQTGDAALSGQLSSISVQAHCCGVPVTFLSTAWLPLGIRVLLHYLMSLL